MNANTATSFSCAFKWLRRIAEVNNLNSSYSAYIIIFAPVIIIVKASEIQLMEKTEKRKNSELSPILLPETENNKKPKTVIFDEMTDVITNKEDLTAIINTAVKDATEQLVTALASLTTVVNSFVHESKEMQTAMNSMLQTNLMYQRRISTLEEQISTLEDQIKRKNIILKGIPSSSNTKDAVEKVLREQLKLPAPMRIKSTRKLFDRNGKMGVIAELDDEYDVMEVFKSTRNLAGTRISIERDLNRRRQEFKKKLLVLRRNILGINNAHKIQVRDDKLKINGKIFQWNKEKVLVSGNTNGMDALISIFGNSIRNLDVNYENIDLNVYNNNNN